MASLISRNGRFYAQWSDASRTPQTKRHALHTDNRKTAARLMETAEEAYRLGRWDAWIDTLDALNRRPAAPVSTGGAVEAFLTARARIVRPETLSTYRSVLNRFAAAAGPSIPLARLTAASVEGFVCGGTVGARTERKHLRIIRALFAWAVTEGHARENVAAAVRPTPEPARLPRAITEAELDAVCEALTADYARQRARRVPTCREGDLVWMVPAFRFALYSGLRASELSRLRWGHLDFERGLISIERQKSGKAGTVPLTSRAAAVLADVSRAGAEDFVFIQPLYRATERNAKNTVGRLGKTFTKYRKAAGITRPLTFHSTRHGFATALATAGKSAWVIQAACRHSDVKVSQVYVTLANEHLRAELNDVFG